jgi:hypothetical protein
MAQARRMEIIIEIHQGEDGRAAGTVRAVGSTSKAQSFSGNLEFLALVEDLYKADVPSSAPPKNPTKGSDNV